MGRTPFSIRFPDELLDRLVALAGDEERTISNTIVVLLREALAAREKLATVSEVIDGVLKLEPSAGDAVHLEVDTSGGEV